MKRSNYIVQVPKQIPDNTLTDTLNRKWIKASELPTTETTWTDEEDYWYVWFHGSDCPEDGEKITIQDEEYEVDKVIRLYQYKRAVVVFS